MRVLRRGFATLVAGLAALLMLTGVAIAVGGFWLAEWIDTP